MGGDHRRAKEIFLEVCELAPSARAAHLDRLCGDTPDLRQEVEELLGFHEHPSQETTPALLDRLETASEQREDEPLPEVPNYRVLRLIGEGGMGAVYEAEQLQPVQRRVAIKLLKRGLDTKQIVGRFEAERQALALMDHPNIARVFDAGATRDGLPFFAMEFVEGMPITEHCDEDRLAIAARLRLFVTVCEAVQHAHQKGVIHRDLKPSNVLVERVAERPVVKVIDFGIAKAVHGRLSGGPVFTEVGQLLGTPLYMSPEQAVPGRLDVDTRSDVYSLGVLLYELLTGRLPLESDELRSPDRHDRGRTSGEGPTRPSQRVRQPSSVTADVAGRRRLATPALSRQLRGDLDWIVMKALERDRSRRYPAASELAADVERYLADQPVLAGPPTALYRVRKFVQRHRVGVASAVLVSLAVVVGSITATVGLVQARQAQARARQEAATAEEVIRFMVELFEVSDPGEARGSTMTAREILDRGVARIDSELADQPRVRGRLMEAMGQVYGGLGLYDSAAQLLRDALERARAQSGVDDPGLARTTRRLAQVLREKGEYEEAERLFRQSLAMTEETLGPDHRFVGESLTSLANLFLDTGRYHEAENLLRRALEIQEAALGPDHPDVANVLNSLGAVRATLGDRDGAIALWERALAARERSLGPDHHLVGHTLTNLAGQLRYRGDYEAAQDRLVRAIAVLETTLGPSHPDLAMALNNLAEVHYSTGEYDAARPLYERALAIQEAVFGPEHREIARTVGNLGKVQLEQRELDASRANLERSLAMRLRILGPDHIDTGYGYGWLGYFHFSTGDLAAAERDYQRALEIVYAAAPEEPALAMMFGTYAQILRQLDRDGEAAVAESRAEEIRSATARP